MRGLRDHATSLLARRFERRRYKSNKRSLYSAAQTRARIHSIDFFFVKQDCENMVAIHANKMRMENDLLEVTARQQSKKIK